MTSCGCDNEDGGEMSYSVVTGPALEPVTLDEAKLQLRIDHDAEDTLIESYIAAARELVETDTKRALSPQTFLLKMDHFPIGGFGYPSTIYVRRPPVTSVTEIMYLDGNGAWQTLGEDIDYIVDLVSEPARISPTYSKIWPATRYQPGAVKITFKAGYTSFPERAKQAIRLLVSHWYVNREAVGQVGKEIDLAYQACVNRLKWTL